MLQHTMPGRNKTRHRANLWALIRSVNLEPAPAVKAKFGNESCPFSVHDSLWWCRSTWAIVKCSRNNETKIAIERRQDDENFGLF